MMLMPDEHIAATYRKEVEPNMKQGATLAFAHGFNIHFGQVIPREDLDVRDDRAEGARAYRTLYLRPGRRHALPDRRGAGQERHGA